MDAAGDSFTRELFVWQRQILADRALTPICLHVALVIGQHINRQTGEAWPSQETIAEQLGLTDRGVRNAIDQLATRGHLIVAKRQGRTESNRYRISLECRNGGSGSDSDCRNDGSSIDAECRNDGSASRDEYRNNHATITGTVVPPNHLIEPSEDTDSVSADSRSKPKAGRPKASTSDDDFAEWWLQVPKAVGKADARKAYDRAITSGDATHAELMVGITRYAAERAREVERDPENVRFTKHPAAWIRAGRWADAPQPGAAHRPAGRPRAGPVSFLDLAMQRMDDD